MLTLDHAVEKLGKLSRKSLEEVLSMGFGYGIETIFTDEFYRHHEVDEYPVPVLEYINTGETYHATLCHDLVTGETFIGSWGDWYEEYMFEVDNEGNPLR